MVSVVNVATQVQEKESLARIDNCSKNYNYSNCYLFSTMNHLLAKLNRNTTTGLFVLKRNSTIFSYPLFFQGHKSIINVFPTFNAFLNSPLQLPLCCCLDGQDCFVAICCQVAHLYRYNSTLE